MKERVLRAARRQPSVAAAVLLTCIVTAYTAADPGMDGRGITATGARVRDGWTVAASWDHHPPGTRVWIGGIGWRTVDDTGGAVRRGGQGRLDVYMVDRSAALAWGRRTVPCMVRSGGEDRGAY